MFDHPDKDEDIRWERRLDSLIKAINDESKALNEAAQSQKRLHAAFVHQTELMVAVFSLIASHLYDKKKLPKQE